MRCHRPTSHRLWTLLAVPFLAGCLQFETQTIEYRYDAAQDAATLHLVYHGLFWDDDNAEAGAKALSRAVEGGEACLVDWPLHLQPQELKEKLVQAQKENEPPDPTMQFVVENVTTKRVGFFRNAQGQLSGGQIVRIGKLRQLVDMANQAISKWIVEGKGRPDDAHWDRHTTRMLLDAARIGHAWIRLNGNAIELHGFCSDHDFVAAKRTGVREMLTGIKGEKELAMAVAWIANMPLSLRREGQTFAAILGNPNGRTRIEVPREGRKPYKDHLEQFAIKSWGLDLDQKVAPKLIGPDETELSRFAMTLGLRERVRILLALEGDQSAAALKRTLDELPHEPDLKQATVAEFWKTWLKNTAPKPLEEPEPEGLKKIEVELK